MSSCLSGCLFACLTARLSSGGLPWLSDCLSNYRCVCPAVCLLYCRITCLSGHLSERLLIWLLSSCFSDYLFRWCSCGDGWVCVTRSCYSWWSSFLKPPGLSPIAIRRALLQRHNVRDIGVPMPRLPGRIPQFLRKMPHHQCAFLRSNIGVYINIVQSAHSIIDKWIHCRQLWQHIDLLPPPDQVGQVSGVQSTTR
jgi:hypothetical protein